MEKYIQLIEACSDQGAGTQGASFGAEALQAMAKQQPGGLLARIPRRACHFPYHGGYSAKSAKDIEIIYHICQTIAFEVQETILNGRFPLMVSGDHSCAAGTIAGIKIAKPDSRLGAIWIDAHADLHSPFTTPSGNMHGMPLAASINEDNRNCSKRMLDHRTMVFWDKFKRIGGIAPKILPSDIVYISLRDFEPEEASLIARYGMKVIPTGELRRLGVAHTVNAALSQLSHCTDIYVLSFDTDSLDASVCIGTGLPVAGGLMPWEAEELTVSLLGDPRLACFEITELNPFFDSNNETTQMVYRILENSIAAIHQELVAWQPKTVKSL